MSTVSHARVTLASQWIKLVIQLGGFVILSRLLAPADFGLIAMVAVVVAVASTFSDFGLSLAGIQAPTLSKAQKSALFFSNVLIGVVAALLVVLSATPLADFFGEPRLIAVTPFLAIPLLLNSVGAQFRVELNRESRFGALAFQDVLSATVGLCVGVLTALLGAGFWALVLQPIAQSATSLVTSMVQSRWIPGRPAPLRDIGSFIKFGFHTSVLQVANLVSTSVDVASIGRVQGATSLGLYSRSSQIVSLLFAQIASPLTRVLLPRLSRPQSRSDLNVALRRVEHAVSFPLFAAISFVASIGAAAIPFVFGTQWVGMTPILQAMCAGAAFQTAGYVFYWATLATARTGVLLMAELPGRLVMVVGALICAPYGATAVAWVMAAGQLAILIGSCVFVRLAGVDTVHVLRGAGMPAVSFSLAFVVAESILIMDGLPALVRIALASVGWIGAVCLSLIARPVRRGAKDFLKIVLGGSTRRSGGTI